MGSIEELERQRAERHRLIDKEFDERIRRVRAQCKHSRSWEKYWHPIYGPQRIYATKCRHCGAGWPWSKA